MLNRCEKEVTLWKMRNFALKMANRPKFQTKRSFGKNSRNKRSTQAEHQVERAFLLDVVVSQSAAVFQLLASEDQALLVRGDAFLVLDLLLHVLDGVA